MNPVNDIVLNLLQTPFSQWKDEDKCDVLKYGRQTDPLSIRVEKKKNGKLYNIHFRTNWFEDNNWLCSSRTLQKLFCWPCLLFSKKDSAWSKDGFCDLANITRSLHKHGDCREHLKCSLMLRTYEKNQNTIADALKENAELFKTKFNENVRLNRLFLKIVIKAVIYLCKQELAFRGHDESNNSMNRGNFKELLALLMSECSLEIRNQYEKIKNVFSGDSKTIQNEIIECISEYINDYVKNEINDAQFFSIQVDDTTDINQTSQCSLIVRFIDSKGELAERFLGFYDVSEDRTSDALFNLLGSILEPFEYEKKLIGQCFDGASVMTGHLNGLQKQIKDKAPQAVFVHCLAHRLNLVLQQSFSKITKCRIFFATLSGIPTFFHHSAKRSFILNSNSTSRIPTKTETRWSSNSKLLNVIVEDWKELKEVFEILTNSEKSDKKTIAQAKGFLNEMNNFEFTFLAFAFNDIFSSTDLLFEILQKKSLDINYCISQIKRTQEILRNKRSHDIFKPLFERVSKISAIKFKREYAASTQQSIFQKYRQLYFEILDHILIEMDTRFQDCDKLEFVCLADTTKFEQYNLYFPTQALENLQTFYKQIFKKQQRLKDELGLLYSESKFRNISTQELLRMLHADKDIFAEAYKLFSLILTVPSTSVSVERSFSCLKRIKTCTRNSIAQERLTSLANISIQRDILTLLMDTRPFHDNIIDKFAASKNRRIDLIYKK